MIDLHVHTTASDGRSSPEELVTEVVGAGIRTVAVTDHDTTEAIEAVSVAAEPHGLEVVPGIEITAVDDGRDIHVLGYFVDTAHDDLAQFLSRQREDRRRRLFEIIAVLDRLGVPIDTAPLMAAAAGHRSVGRPLVAAALVEAGHVRDIGDAFDQFLAEGRPAFVARRGASPTDVIGQIHGAGGLASLAHPGKTDVDTRIAALARSGLDAIEVFHPDHDEETGSRYRRMARDLDLLVTGGSDYHGPRSGRDQALGRVGLPAPDFDRLRLRLGQTRGSRD